MQTLIFKSSRSRAQVLCPHRFYIMSDTYPMNHVTLGQPWQRKYNAYPDWQHNGVNFKVNNQVAYANFLRQGEQQVATSKRPEKLHAAGSNHIPESQSLVDKGTTKLNDLQDCLEHPSTSTTKKQKETQQFPSRAQNYKQIWVKKDAPSITKQRQSYLWRPKPQSANEAQPNQQPWRRPQEQKQPKCKAPPRQKNDRIWVAKTQIVYDKYVNRYVWKSRQENPKPVHNKIYANHDKSS